MALRCIFNREYRVTIKIMESSNENSIISQEVTIVGMNKSNPDANGDDSSTHSSDIIDLYHLIDEIDINDGHSTSTSNSSSSSSSSSSTSTATITNTGSTEISYDCIYKRFYVDEIDMYKDYENLNEKRKKVFAKRFQIYANKTKAVVPVELPEEQQLKNSMFKIIDFFNHFKTIILEIFSDPFITIMENFAEMYPIKNSEKLLIEFEKDILKLYLNSLAMKNEFDSALVKIMNDFVNNFHQKLIVFENECCGNNEGGNNNILQDNTKCINNISRHMAKITEIYTDTMKVYEKKNVKSCPLCGKSVNVDGGAGTSENTDTVEDNDRRSNVDAVGTSKPDENLLSPEIPIDTDHLLGQQLDTAAPHNFNDNICYELYLADNEYSTLL